MTSNHNIIKQSWKLTEAARSRCDCCIFRLWLMRKWLKRKKRREAAEIVVPVCVSCTLSDWRQHKLLIIIVAASQPWVFTCGVGIYFYHDGWWSGLTTFVYSLKYIDGMLCPCNPTLSNLNMVPVVPQQTSNVYLRSMFAIFCCSVSQSGSHCQN